jgi:hypothetical protein
VPPLGQVIPLDTDRLAAHLADGGDGVVCQVAQVGRLAVTDAPGGAGTQARSALSNLIRWNPENEEAIAAAREEIKRARRAFETAWQDSGQPVNPHGRHAPKLSEAEARAALERLQAR